MTRRTPLRRAARQASPARELAGWKMKFQTGYDYFGDLPDLGLSEEKLTRAQIRDAWQRLGAAFLAGWEPNPKAPRPPWALEQFGPP